MAERSSPRRAAAGLPKKVKEAGLTLRTFRNPDDLARQVERSLVELKQRRRAERESARQAGRAKGEGAEQDLG